MTGTAGPPRPAMVPRMTEAEVALLGNLLGHARRYLEFGTGGSTVLASQRVAERIVSVDSAQPWLDRVAAACAAAESRTRPELVLADIGPVAAWGQPADDSTRDRWPAYHEGVWSRPGAGDVDLCLVDGRFRVACFMQAMLHARPDTLIAVHDYQRKNYWACGQVARQVLLVDQLAVFVVGATVDRAAVGAILEKFRYVPA